MEGIFVKVLNLSIQASILIIVVLLLRFILNKSPRWMKCFLWTLVAIRLVCPFSIESIFSLAPDAEVVNVDNYIGMANIQSEAADTDSSINEYVEIHDNEGKTVEKNIYPLYIFSIIWLVGIVILVAYALGSYLKIWRRVKLSIRTKDNIYLCDRIDSPFIFGIIRPRIYLPSDISEEQKESVIAHERAHLKRLDHFWKPFGFGLLTVYWFNPLCWLAYILLCRDIELACDEKVIKDMDAKQKKMYSKVLLSFSESEKHTLTCPLAFGEVGVKERIKAILNYKKPAFWMIAVAVVSILVTSVLFLTSPKNNTYEITFRIPAGCENQLVISDEEISPKRRTVSFLVGQDIGDAAIQLKGVEVKEENAYDEPVYATPGMPAKMEVEKGAWFQVGIYASNDTAEEKIVYMTVKDVEVRIAANKDTTAEIAPLQDIIEVSVPTIDLSATTGADGSTMYYADESMFIFGGYYGLFVYDVTKNQIIRSVDLAPIGCNDTQGDNACEIVVTEDGSKVLLCPVSGNMMYVYSVMDNQMWREPYNLDGYDLYRDKYSDEAVFDGKRAPYKKDGDIRFYCLVNDTTIGELGYAMDIQSSYHTIFAETNMTGADTIQDSRNSDGTPSRAYVETLQERISADMVAGKLPFVVTSAIRENPLRLEVELTEMTDENINIIRLYETNGSAITFVQSSGNVQELQYNNDSQSQMTPQISKEDENMGVEYKRTAGGSYVVDGDMLFGHYIVLTGTEPNAAHGTQFIVLTNDQHITYEQVAKSFYSGNSFDSSTGTIVIGMKTID